MASVPSFVSRWFKNALISFWARKEGTEPAEGGPRDTPQPTDSLMRTMNLVMPLKDKTAIGRAQAAMVVGSALDEIYSGLDNAGTVHMARFSIVDDNLLMFSWYDGDFHTYIRDFIITLGHAFNAIVEMVEDTPPLPCWEHVDEFIDWIHRHDLFQVPDDPGLLVEVLSPGDGDIDLNDLPRNLVLRLHENPNVQLGSYRAYPGFSVAQVRHGLGVGW